MSESLTACASLSVVMLNYNYSQYIELAITTILSQSYTPLEFIVIDDCSTDDSVSKIEALFSDKPHCRIVRHPVNKGILYSLNEAIEVAKGTHVYLASSDDYVEPEFFKQAMGLIEKNPSIGICCGKPVYFKQNSPPFVHEYLGIKNEVQILFPNDLVQLFRKSNFSIAIVTSIYRRDVLLEMGGFNPQLKSACDGFLIHQICFRYPIAYIPQPFGAVRLHSSSYSADIYRSKNIRNEMFKHLIHSIDQEKTDVARRFRKSGILLYFGKPLLIYILLRPYFWRYLSPIIWKQITHLRLKFLTGR